MWDLVNTCAVSGQQYSEVLGEQCLTVNWDLSTTLLRIIGEKLQEDMGDWLPEVDVWGGDGPISYAQLKAYALDPWDLSDLSRSGRFQCNGGPIRMPFVQLWATG